MRLFITLIFILNTTFLYANPIHLAEVIMHPESPDELAKQTCSSEKYDDCNLNMCSLPSSISESPDCQNICRQEAEKACTSIISN